MGEFALAQFQYLLAGFVASWVFYGLTPYKRPTPFERVVQALIYTAVVQLLATGAALALGASGLASNPPLIFALALAVGLAIAWMTNRDWPHKWLRELGITDQAAHSGNWSAAFRNRPNKWVILNLKDNRRIFGRLRAWPDAHEDDHFLLVNHAWLSDQGDEPRAEIRADGAAPDAKILIASRDVDTVEFVPDSSEGGKP